jgi:hypothetical protein
VGVERLMVVCLETETWVIGKGGAIRGVGEGKDMGTSGFVTLMFVWVCLHCCSGACLCQGLQGTGFVYSWYSRLVSRW